MLFFCGFLSMYAPWNKSDSPERLNWDCRRWIYASTLAYIVDANAGRSSTAVATNSAFRGVFAFIGIETAVPLQVCAVAPRYPESI